MKNPIEQSPVKNEEITLEQGRELRKAIYEKAKELFPNSGSFIGELGPDASLTIFNAKNEQTNESVVGVVKRFTDRMANEIINRRDKENLIVFQDYLDSLI